MLFLASLCYDAIVIVACAGEHYQRLEQPETIFPDAEMPLDMEEVEEQ